MKNRSIVITFNTIRNTILYVFTNFFPLFLKIAQISPAFLIRTDWGCLSLENSSTHIAILIIIVGILGFASHQTFESTSYDQICQAFLRRSKKGWKTLQPRTFQHQTSTFYLLTMNTSTLVFSAMNRLGDYNVFLG